MPSAPLLDATLALIRAADNYDSGWVKIGKRKKGHEAGSKEQNSITKARKLENTKKGRWSFLHFIVEDFGI
jgi:hypothetical protein